jgi:glycosyltransferase involved in cell wall biosynthesis
MAFAYGKPVVVTAVGGLVEACEGYEGAVLVEPANPQSLVDGIRRARELQGTTYEHHATFPAAAQKYRALLERLHTSPRSATPDGEGVSSAVD